MSKHRVKNNIAKWALKSVPFFMIVGFVFFNVPFFVFNASLYQRPFLPKAKARVNELLFESSFTYILSLEEKNRLKEMLALHKMSKDDYPQSLNELHPDLRSKNWIYSKTQDRYILEFVPTRFRKHF